MEKNELRETIDMVFPEEKMARGDGQGVGGPKQGTGGPAQCTCPECGAKVKHNPGTPCTSMTCPKCGAKMVGVEKEAEESEKYPEGLPFAGYKDFAHCVRSVMAKHKGWKKERAEGYCAVIKRKVEKAEELFQTGHGVETIDISILEELGKEFSMPYEIKFKALREGKFNGVFYPEEELKKAAHTLMGKPLTVNHGKQVQDVIGRIVFAQWNEEMRHIEGRAEIVEPFKDIAMQVHQGLIKGVSVEVYVEYSQTKNGVTAKNAEFSALSLVKNPACKPPSCGIIE